MAQYRQGLVSVVSGSPWVSGSGTLFDSTSGILPGVLFNLQGDSGWYYVASVTSNTTLSLTTNYTGQTQYNQSYVIVRDYLTPQNIPLMHKGDCNWTSIFNEAMLRIKTSLDSVASGAGSPSGSGLGLDGAYDIENIITVDSAPVIFNRLGTYQSAQNANAFRIIDQTNSGPATMPPPEGALQYIYSKHRVPLIAVSNVADRAQPASPSDTAHAAIVGLAMSDEHDQFETFSPLTNVGVAAYSIDYHNTYAANGLSNVGLYAYSQRGYGISASSLTSYALYVNQTTALDGIYSSARRPLTVTNQAFGDASNSFALRIQSRRAGLDVQSVEPGTAGAPLIKVTTTGITLESTGKASFSNASDTALEVLGTPGTQPLVNISTTAGLPLKVYSDTGSYAIHASTPPNARPAIKAINGIITYAITKDNILNPEEGTIVYSKADEQLLLFNGSDWINIAASGSGGSAEVPTLQEAYEAGRIITITPGAINPVTITSDDEMALRVINNNIAETRPAISAYAARGWGLTVTTDSTESTYGGISVSAGEGTCLRARSNGPLASYITPGIVGGYGMTMSVGVGGGIEVVSANEDNYTIGPLSLQTTKATGITMLTQSGKLIDYNATQGVLTGDRYAITASCGTGGGMHIYGTGSVTANLRLENTNTLSTLLEIEAGGGTGIDIENAQRAITASSQGDYAIYARSNDYPSVKSYNGIVAYSTSYTSIPNPEPGTITFSWWDKLLYYYIDDLNGWMPVAIPSGYVAPTGAPSCLCIDGVIVYTSDINSITSGAREEGQLVFDHNTQKVYVVDENLEWLEIGSSASGAVGGDSCICPDGINVFHWDKEDITEPTEGTILYEAENQAVYYWNGAEWIEMGAGDGTGGVIRYSRGFHGRYGGVAEVMNDVASFIVPYDGILTGIKFAVDNAPGTNGITFDVRRKQIEGTAGSSVLGGVPITIGDGDNESSPRALSQVVTQFDSIIFDITDVDGTTPGGDDIRVLYYIQSDFSGAKGITLLVTGNITAGESIENAASFIVPYDAVLVEAKAAVDVAPTGGNLVIDLNKKIAGGTTWNNIATSQIVISQDEYESTIVTVNEPVSQYDHINMDITQSGSVVAGGSDLRLLISLTEVERDSYTVKNITSNYTVVATDRFISIDSSGGPITITMPSPGDVTGIPFLIKKNSDDTYTITINGTNIDGSPSITMIAPWQSVTLVSNGTRYNRV